MSTDFKSSLSLSMNHCATNLPQDSQQQFTDEETTSELTHHPIIDESAVQCSMCNDQDVIFSRRDEFLRHICIDHFREEHLVDFPEFLPNDIFQQAMKLAN